MSGNLPRSGSDHLPPGVAWADLVAGATLPRVIATLAEADPTRCVLVGEGCEITRGELGQRSAAAAGRLAAAGLRPGDRVLLSGPNSVDLVVAHVACLRAGYVVVPVNGAYRRPEIDHLLNDATPRAAIVANASWMAWFEEHDPTIVTVGTDLRLADGPPPPLDVAAPDAPAIIGYTSGTTGRPKGAVLSQGNLLAGAAAVVAAWRWSDRDRLVLSLPLFHMHGLGVGLHGTLYSGGSAVLLERFTPDLVLDAVPEHGATMFFGVPTMYHRLASSPRLGELAALRLCVAGSAPLPAELHERLHGAAGVTVLERYGMTETVMLTSNPYDGDRRAGSVGFPLPGVELRLWGAADSPEPAVGEIEVRGPNVFAGYWARPDATAEVFTSDGWFRTGDLARIDRDGYVTIVGRAKDLIISGGYNVYPREVEDALASHPRVNEVAVVGLPSEEWGEIVTACVVVSEDAPAPTLEDLRAHAQDALAFYKLPRAVRIVAELPRNALGKVLRAELAATVGPR